MLMCLPCVLGYCGQFSIGNPFAADMRGIHISGVNVQSWTPLTSRGIRRRFLGSGSRHIGFLKLSDGRFVSVWTIGLLNTSFFASVNSTRGCLRTHPLHV